MATRDLNERQKQVLQWIVDGVPARDWPDETHKSTAKALQSRRLVTVRRRSGVWSAEPTPAGLYVAKHGTYPDGHWATESPPSGTGGKRPPKATRAVEPAEPAAPAPRPHGRAAAEALVAEVRAAGGRLFVSGSRQADVRKAMYRANAIEGLLREGERLVSDQHGVTLEPDVAAMPVPARLSTKPHPAITQVRDSRALRGFTKDAARRGLLVLQALAVTAAKDGHGVAAHPNVGLVLTVSGQKVNVTLHEPQNRSPRVLTKDEEHRKARGEYLSGPSYDYEQSGRLRLRVEYTEFTEPKPTPTGKIGWRMEDRLDRVYAACLHEAAVRAERERQREAEAERRRQQYETDKANARIAYVEMMRAEVLAEQVDRWVRCGQIRAYVAALKERASVATPAEIHLSGEWIAWAEEHADGLDPFKSVPQMPQVRVPDDYELARVMGLRDPRWG